MHAISFAPRNLLVKPTNGPADAEAIGAAAGRAGLADPSSTQSTSSFSTVLRSRSERPSTDVEQAKPKVSTKTASEEDAQEPVDSADDQQKTAQDVRDDVEPGDSATESPADSADPEQTVATDAVDDSAQSVSAERSSSPPAVFGLAAAPARSAEAREASPTATTPASTPTSTKPAQPAHTSTTPQSHAAPQPASDGAIGGRSVQPGAVSPEALADPSQSTPPPADADIASGVAVVADRSVSDRSAAPPEAPADGAKPQGGQPPAHLESHNHQNASSHREGRDTPQHPTPPPATDNAAPADPDGGLESDPAHALKSAKRADATERLLNMDQGKASRQPAEKALVSSVSRGLAAAINQKGGSLTIRLTPDSLGQMRIEMHVNAGTVSADLQVGSVEAHDLLTRNLMALRETLEARGMQVERLQVQISPSLAQSARSNAQGQDAQQQGNSGREDSETQTHHDAGGGQSRGHREESESDAQGQLHHERWNTGSSEDFEQFVRLSFNAVG